MNGIEEYAYNVYSLERCGLGCGLGGSARRHNSLLVGAPVRVKGVFHNCPQQKLRCHPFSRTPLGTGRRQRHLPLPVLLDQLLSFVLLHHPCLLLCQPLVIQSLPQPLSPPTPLPTSLSVSLSSAGPSFSSTGSPYVPHLSSYIISPLTL